MADAYIGQIEIFAFGFAPRNWALCAGQLLAISQNQALFSLLGTTYGGDGIRSFALPDLRGRLPIGQGAGPGLTARTEGEAGGEETHTLLLAETPPHTHGVAAIANVDASKSVPTPGSTVILSTTSGKLSNGDVVDVKLYGADANPDQTLAPAAIGNTGGQPHSNMMPYLGINFCICLNGIFPSRN